MANCVNYNEKKDAEPRLIDKINIFLNFLKTNNLLNILECPLLNI